MRWPYIPVLTAICLAGNFASTAGAGDRELPWASGQAVVSPFEATAAQWVNRVAERQDLQVICNGNHDWGVLAAQGRFDPAFVWGYVIQRFSVKTLRWEPDPYTHVSEAGCLYVDRFWAAPDKNLTKNCQTGSSPVYEDRVVSKVSYQWRTVKKRVEGKIKKVRVRKRVVVDTIVSVKVGEEPVYSICTDWSDTLFALNTLAHETMHLRGVTSESVAECWGMQLMAQVAIHFGATREFAREIASDYLTAWYTPNRGAYWHPDCFDGGSLDLSPASSSWPAGF